jgi:hypothetical protein
MTVAQKIKKHVSVQESANPEKSNGIYVLTY